MALCIGLSCRPAIAAELRKFNIPAGPAEPSVREFARQARLSVLYEPGSLAHYKTRALKGEYEPIEALRILLNGSGLDFVLSAPRYISLRAGENHQVGPPEAEFLPTVEISARASANTFEMPAGVIVRTINAEELSRQGFTTVPDWVRTLTQNQGMGANERTSYLREAQSNVAYGSGLNLYGIGQRATLILVNGQRLAPSGSAGSFTDISNIPLSAVDHIDLISDGASTLYGADAVGGIVNFVLRGEYSPQIATLSLGWPGPLSENVLGLSLPSRGEQWRAVWGLELYSRNGLPASKRSQATSDLTPWGGSNFDIPYGNPGSILDSERQLFAIPAHQNGQHLSAADLLPGPHSYDRYSGTWILPQQRRINGLFDASYDVSGSTEISLAALLNERWIKSRNTALGSPISVPNTNPFYVNPVPGDSNPVTVLYGFGSDLGNIIEKGTVKSGQVTGGVTHHFNQNWELDASGGYSYENQLDIQTNLVDFSRLQAYLDSADPLTAFNPFGDGSHTNPQTLEAIRAHSSANYRSAFRLASVKTTGLMDILPAGPLALTAGYDYRLQSFLSTVSSNYSSAALNFDTDRDRTFRAAYLQLSAPVLAGDLSSGVSYNLQLSSGMRYVHFDDAGSAALPSAGFALETSQGLNLSGSWARMFRPPNLPDLDETSNYAAVYPLPDPKSSTGYTNTLVWGGNNPQLRPETANSWILGVKWTPPWDPGISVDAQYYRTLSHHQVLPSQLLSLTILSDPQYSYLVSRDVSSAELANICSRVLFQGIAGQCHDPDIKAVVDLRLRSAETMKTDGIDFKALYRRVMPRGELSANLQATWILHYKETQAPGDDFLSYRNTAHNPTALRLRGVFRWENQQLSVSPAFNLQGSYTDTDSVPNRPVGAWMTWDLVIGYKATSLDELTGGHSALSLRGLNIFNRQPPFQNNSVGLLGFDPENGDLLGRRINLRLEHEW